MVVKFGEKGHHFGWEGEMIGAIRSGKGYWKINVVMIQIKNINLNSS